MNDLYLEMLMRQYIAILVTLVFVNSNITAQVGIGTNTPDPSSALQIQAGNKGVLLPRLTAAQRLSINSAANGLIVYDLDSSSLFIYNGGTSSWKKIKAVSSLATLWPALQMAMCLFGMAVTGSLHLSVICSVIISGIRMGMAMEINIHR